MTGVGTVKTDSGPHALADRLVATLGDRPFTPTAGQLAEIGWGDMAEGTVPGPFEHVVADRYAGLLAGHVVQDVRAVGAPAAYARIWLCARSAFLRSFERDMPQAPQAPDAAAWENEGGAARAEARSGAAPDRIGGRTAGRAGHS